MGEERKCIYCGKIETPTRFAKRLCHIHYNAYKRTKIRIPIHIEKLNAMFKLVELVEGKKDLKIDTNGTNYQPDFS